MATISLYNHTVAKLASGDVDLAALKFMLLNDTATFDATDTTLTAVAGANEVSGNGWTAGGEALANAAVTTVTTNDAMLDADDISVTATGGPIGPSAAGVIYDDTDADDAPLAFVDFEGEREAGEGTPMLITWSSSGIIQFTYT